jgi:very-short-patch-repair endonuclease
LIIEIDGDSHADPDQASYDLERTAWLQAGGYTVIRFPNNEVEKDVGNVLEIIQNKIKELSGTGD